MVVTSRAMPLDQTVAESDGAVQRANVDDIIAALCADDEEGAQRLRNSSIQMMTYDKLIRLIHESNVEGRRTLDNVKIFVLDEIHALFVDNRFIPGMQGLATWIRDRLFSSEDQIFIGLTATPEIVLHINRVFNKMPLTPVVDEVLLPYKAKNVICTDYVGALGLIREKTLPGKSLMICNNKTQCGVAFQALRDSAIVIGTTNKIGGLKSGTALPVNRFMREKSFEVLYQPYMDEIRWTIANTRRFPYSVSVENYLTGRYETRRVNTLLSTSTLREGFNLDASSGVRNVIVMSPFDWEIKQVVGRCRYDVENLVIVRPLYYGKEENDNTFGYNLECIADYDDFIAGRSSAWFDRIANVVSCGVEDVVITEEARRQWEHTARYNTIKSDAVFQAFMCRAEKFVTHDSENPILIYGEQMRGELCEIARQINLFPGLEADRYTFNRIRNEWVRRGFAIEERQTRIGGSHLRCTILYNRCDPAFRHITPRTVAYKGG